MFFPLFTTAPQAGGLKEISRWLSDAVATPPDIIADKNRIPEGCQRDCVTISGIPPGCCAFILGSGGVGRVATSTTGLFLASLRLALALSLKRVRNINKVELI
jgi:hypothetical protein